MRVWLDDLRPIPDGFTHWAKTADEAITLLATGRVEMISLDHDLEPAHYAGGGYCSTSAHGSTGYTVAAWIEQAVANGEIKLPEWSIHSMNPSGAARIRAAMESAERLQAERKES